ncbi:MAG: hypothetical protein Q9177_006681 [Variospora cf. flavescens]
MAVTASSYRRWLSGGFFPMLAVLLLCVNIFDSDFFGIRHRSQQGTGVDRFYPWRLKLDQLSKRTLVLAGPGYGAKNQSSVSSENPLGKRDDDDDKQSYDGFLCKGEKALQTMMTRVPSDRVYTRQDQLDAWSVTPRSGGVSPELVPALSALGISTSPQVVEEVISSQSKEVKGANGQNYRSTNGIFDNVFIPNRDKGMIIGKNNHSPAQYKRPDHPLPKLHRWSDVVWQNWTAIAGDDARHLRYILHENVWTQSVRRLMEYMEGEKPDKLNLPYPGKLYDMQSDNGVALLGTPHGVGVTWLIADHSNALERKIPAVRVFTTSATRSRDSKVYNLLFELRNTVEGPE